MIAALPMYDRPETAPANDRLWAAVRERLGMGPERLTRDMDVWDIWQSPDLLLAQTCGFPFRARLSGTVTLVGTPDYGVEGCPPGYYRSVIVVNVASPAQSLADLDGAAIAFNEPLSQSGWAAPAAHFAKAGLSIGERRQSGSHRDSARMVAEGKADFAALDAVSWALVQDHDTFAARLRVLDLTDPTPGLPVITAKARDPGPIRRALEAAIAELQPADRRTLHLCGLTRIDAQDYLAVPTPAAP